jgi:hypothetical protein
VARKKDRLEIISNRSFFLAAMADGDRFIWRFSLVVPQAGTAISHTGRVGRSPE